MFQLSHGPPEELHRLAHEIAPDLTDQPSLLIYRGTIAHHGPLEFQMPVQNPYESDQDFDLPVLWEKRRFQKEISRCAPLTVVRDGKKLES
jgi:hypothetical protein